MLPPDQDTQKVGLPDPLVGTMLGSNYRVIGRLGEGGMGVVYVAEHVSLQKRFAAKVLSAQLASSADARARFETEALAASRLEHEHIVSVNDFGLTEDGRPYLVMELLKGGTLYERMAQGPIGLEDAVAIMVPVCEGLEAAHDAGIVHRDVKPENIFLAQRSGGRFRVKVLDFGIAKLRVQTNRVTQVGQVLGSPVYMAPEACRGLESDHRSDIYAVGVVLYQLLCGRPPFFHENSLRILHMHMSELPPRPTSIVPGLPAAIEAVLLRALEKDPGRRYQAISDLADELSAALPVDASRRLHASTTRTPTPGPAWSISPTGDRASSDVDVTSRTARHETPSPDAAVMTPVLASAVGTARESERGWLVPAGFVVLLLAGGALWYALGRASAPPVSVPAPEPPVAVVAPEPSAPPTAVTKVRLVVTTTPPGANATLAGTPLGATPLDLTLDPISGTSSELVLTLPGFEDERRTVPRDQDAQIDASLRAVRPEPVISRPRGKRPRPPKPPTKPDPNLEIRRQR